MRKKESAAKLLLLGIGLLLVSLLLPGIVFFMQDAGKKKELVSMEDEVVAITLSDKTSLEVMNLREKVQLAGSETAQAVMILDGSFQQEVIQEEIADALSNMICSVKNMGENGFFPYLTEKEERTDLAIIVQELEEFDLDEIFVASTYPVLLMDRVDFTRQYKAWETLVRVGGYTFGAWVDVETGYMVAAWETSSGWRIPMEWFYKHWE